MTRLAFVLFALTLATACDRGPEIPANAEPPAPSGRATASPTQMPTAPGATQSALPAGHPGGGAPGGPAGTPTIDPANPALAGVAWSVPDGLTSRAPSSSMRAAEYVATGEAGEAVLAVYYFPGMGATVDENVQRWIGQFTTDDGQPITGTHSEHITVGGLNATKVDVSGKYVGMGGDGGDGQRLLGLIIEAPTGPVFFKLVGPAATVTAALPAFEALAQSVHPAS